MFFSAFLCLSYSSAILGIYVPGSNLSENPLATLGIKTIGWQDSGGGSLVIHQNYSGVKLQQHTDSANLEKVYEDNRNRDHGQQVMEQWLDQFEDQTHIDQKVGEKTQVVDNEFAATSQVHQTQFSIKKPIPTSSQNRLYQPPEKYTSAIRQPKQFNPQNFYSGNRPLSSNQLDQTIYTQCPSGATGQFIYDQSCKQFLNCYKGRGHAQNCAPGTLFNPKTLECDYADKVECVSSVNNLLLDLGPISEKLQARCPKGFSGIIPHYTDCSKFINCANGVEHMMDCAPGTLFNVRSNNCDYPHKAECVGGESGKIRGQNVQNSWNSQNQHGQNGYNQNQHAGQNAWNSQSQGGSAGHNQNAWNGQSQSGSTGLNQGAWNSQSGSTGHNQGTWNTQGQSGSPGYNQGTWNTQGQSGSAGHDQGAWNSQSQGGSVGHNQFTSENYQSGSNQNHRQGHKYEGTGAYSNQLQQGTYTNKGQGTQHSQFVSSHGIGQNASEKIIQGGRPKCPARFTGLAQHPFDCKKFLNCANGATYIQDCGPGTVFNPSINACDHPKPGLCRETPRGSQNALLQSNEKVSNWNQQHGTKGASSSWNTNGKQQGSWNTNGQQQGSFSTWNTAGQQGSNWNGNAQQGSASNWNQHHGSTNTNGQNQGSNLNGSSSNWNTNGQNQGTNWNGNTQQGPSSNWNQQGSSSSSNPHGQQQGSSSWDKNGPSSTWNSGGQQGTSWSGNTQTGSSGNWNQQGPSSSSNTNGPQQGSSPSWNTHGTQQGSSPSWNTHGTQQGSTPSWNTGGQQGNTQQGSSATSTNWNQQHGTSSNQNTNAPSNWDANGQQGSNWNGNTNQQGSSSTWNTGGQQQGNEKGSSSTWNTGGNIKGHKQGTSTNWNTNPQAGSSSNWNTNPQAGTSSNFNTNGHPQGNTEQQGSSSNWNHNQGASSNSNPNGDNQESSSWNSGGSSFKPNQGLPSKWNAGPVQGKQNTYTDPNYDQARQPTSWNQGTPVQKTTPTPWSGASKAPWNQGTFVQKTTPTPWSGASKAPWSKQTHLNNIDADETVESLTNRPPNWVLNRPTKPGVIEGTIEQQSVSQGKSWPPPFPSTDLNADYVFEEDDLDVMLESELDKADTEYTAYNMKKNWCDAKGFECGNKVCVAPSVVCDGKKDCPNGKDETDCDDAITQFSPTRQTKLAVKEVEKTMNITVKWCAKVCVEQKRLNCKAFNYRKHDGTCFLLDTNVGKTGALIILPNYDYYENKMYKVSCDHGYLCRNKKCISRTQICDGSNDCTDWADEKGCPAEKFGYKINLAGSDQKNSGRIEIEAFGKSGYICDDMFGLRNADVACRELGFPLGALEVRGNSVFAADLVENDTFYMMDDVSCLGNETTLRDCDFGGWGVHNCRPQEIVGVICKTPLETCPEDHWKCKTGNECLQTSFVCDGVYDCTDKSDEVEDFCESPIEVRLANGTSKNNGRVEIRYHGIWGTVCDDDFNDDAAKVVCGQLGFRGSGVVKKGGYYGPGSGPIWLDQVFCQGNETKLASCIHWDWGEHNCDHNEDVGVICSSQEFINEHPRHMHEEEEETEHLPEKCGFRSDAIFLDENSDVHFRVVQGSVAKAGEYPWQASIRVKGKTKSTHWCGAVVISKRYVLTAAHCLSGYIKDAYTVFAGDYDVDVDEGTEQEAYIEDFQIHEYFRSGSKMNNDIALIKLKRPGFKFTDAVQPICLPEATFEANQNANCTISGFGSVESGKARASRNLRAGWIPVQSSEICKMPHVYGEAITEGMICAGSLDEGVDACDGDSGGPLACLSDGVFTLFGLTSWGQHCGYANKPGVYVKVAHYRHWIMRTMKQM